MNITQFVARVRSYLDDSRSLKFSDSEIVYMADEQLRYLTRKLSQTSKDWHNFSLGLYKANARTIFNNTYEWTLPSWVKRVSRVYDRHNTASTETTLSPYRWSGNSNAQFTDEIGKSDSGRRSGWTWEGQRTLRLWNFPQALDLSLEVVKMPAPLFKVIVADVFTDASGFYFPTTASVSGGGGIVYGDLYVEEGSYINSEAQITGTKTATSTNLGEVRRIIYSNSNTIATGRKTACYVDNNWNATLEAQDTVESLLPIPEDHTYLLSLLVLRGLAIKKGNIDLQKSVANAIAPELQDFLENSGVPKDSAGPYFKTSRTTRTGRYDNDRLNPPRFQWW